MKLQAIREVSVAIQATHRFIYFIPEIAEEATRLGVAERGRTYFAFRSAAMGAVPWQVTLATFYNFSPRAVQTMTGVWDAAPPAQWQAARLTAAGGAMRRVGVALTDHEIAEARSLLDPLVSDADYAGKPLAAANASVALPDDPLLALWQELTVLREWRGDAHVLVLADNRVGPCECNILQAATGRFPAAPVARATRLWSDREWTEATARLAARGWLNDDGTATAAGYEARERIEVETDEHCAALWSRVDERSAHRLAALVTPINDAFTAAGTYSG
ncbi:SCO6745 family protein [Nonomuraea lactucae]|uniref:SCO6745 family protein n=1 Tax=Nonomuraea lactucae TaxID=2249762 RepID=UPI000DE5503C|nr:hypothetical protein [Nonomuraea lactucae]